MKYTVTRACGHEETVELYGPNKERESKIKWLESTVCTACYRAEQDAEAAKKCDEVEMLYREYKQDYAECRTKAGSYNKETKTIIVYVPRKPDPERERQERREQAAEELTEAGIPEEQAQAYAEMGASGVREIVDQAIELLGQYDQAEELVELGLTEDNAQAYLEQGSAALHEVVAPVIERLKPHEQLEELIALGLTEPIARQWLDLGADKTQDLYDNLVASYDRDKVEITPEMEANLALGRAIIEILKR